MKQGFDEFFDAIFCRPVGRAIAVALSKTRATPNKVTLCTGALSLTLFPLFAGPGYWPIAGGLMLLAIMVLDCTDGELARLSGGHWTGRVVDGFADTACAVSAHVGMLVALHNTHPVIAGYALNFGHLFAIAFLAGLSMAWNSFVFDGLKQGAKPSSPDDDIEKYRAEANTPWTRFCFRSWEDHVRKVARYRAWGENREHRFLMYHRASPAGPTHHHLGMVIAAFATPWFPLAFLVYFVWAIVVCNLVVVGALHLTSARDTATA